MAANTGSLPQHENIRLTLDNLIDGGGCVPGLQGIVCSFIYTTVEGLHAANLAYLGSDNADIALKSMGVEGKIAFGGDVWPSRVFVGGELLMVSKLILTYYDGGNWAAWIVFGKENSCTLSTANYVPDPVLESLA